MDPQGILEAVRETLEELREEDDASRQLRERIDEMLFVLGEDIDLELRVGRVRGILEDLEDEPIPTDLRTRLWSLSASLEML